MLFVRLFNGLPCFRILDFIPVAAGFSIAFISTYHVSGKVTKQSNDGKSDGANALERRKIRRRERDAFISHEEGSQTK